MEMIERFLLDRVDAKARRATVGGEHHLAAVVAAHEAGAALTVVQLAVTRAEVALEVRWLAAVLEGVPPAGGMGGFGRFHKVLGPR